jgi:transcriptional regulator with XRE-family HTH domain
MRYVGDRQEGRSMATLGEMIHAARTARGMGQYELGSAVGVRNNAISTWENDRVMPDPVNLARLIKVLGMDSDATWLAYARLVNESLEQL